MSAGTDFLASLQKKTVKSTVQQKQQKRANASAVDVSALLEAALRQKKPTEAVADVRQSADVATASFLPPTDSHQGKSTQQKPKSASDKAVLQKQSTSKSKDIVDAGITALIQKALDAKKVMEQPDIAERLQSSMESEFTQLFASENEPQESKFVSTATFRTTKKKIGSIRVAAYIRVSTDMSDQENSYETQEKYFILFYMWGLLCAEICYMLWMTRNTHSRRDDDMKKLSWLSVEDYGTTPLETSVYKGYKQDKIEMRGDRAEMSDFPLYLNMVTGGLDCRDQAIGGFSFVVKIYAVPVVEIIG